MEVGKVESHIELDDPRFPPAWILGNDIADTLAEQTAEEVALPFAVSEAIHWIDAVAAMVRTRLAATHIDAMERDPRSREPPVELKRTRDVARDRRKKEIAEAIACTQHVLPERPVDAYRVRARKRGGMTCITCGGAPTYANRLAWLKQPCCAPAPLAFYPEYSVPRAEAATTIGNQQVHPSHPVIFVPDSGTWICTLCGNTGSEFLRGLASVCNCNNWRDQ